MPVPKPHAGEERDEFMSRCHSAMHGEFPDDAQRNAVCFGAWRNREKAHSMNHVFPRFETKDMNQEERTFEGLAATWDPDLGNDIIHKGAFARTLAHWKSSKRHVPLMDQHTHGSVIQNRLGVMIDAEEKDAGLWTKFKVADTTAGRDLWSLLKDGMVEALSIGYLAVGSPDISEKMVGGVKRRVRNLRELKLLEVSAVNWPMNPNTLIDASSVKGLLSLAKERELTDEEKAELAAIQSEIGALLAVPEPPGLAPDDPHRIELEAMVRGLRVRHLEAFAH